MLRLELRPGVFKWNGGDEVAMKRLILTFAALIPAGLAYADVPSPVRPPSNNGYIMIGMFAIGVAGLIVLAIRRRMRE
jgi:hypothetical protein